MDVGVVAMFCDTGDESTLPISQQKGAAKQRRFQRETEARDPAAPGKTEQTSFLRTYQEPKCQLSLTSCPWILREPDLHSKWLFICINLSKFVTYVVSYWLYRWPSRTQCVTQNKDSATGLEFMTETNHFSLSTLLNAFYHTT